MPNDQVTSGLVDPQGLGEEPLYYFTRVYLLFLQGLFEQFEAGSFRWNMDEKLSEIAITADVPIPRESVDKIPAIVVMRGPAQAGNLSLDQMRDINTKTGEKVRADLWSATMSVNCIAKNDVEAQRIAWIVARHIRNFKTSIQRCGMHKIGDDLQVGPLSPPGALVSGEAEPDLFLVTVFSPFHFMWKESVTPLNTKLLRGVEARLATALLPQAATTTQGRVEARAALRPAGIGGRPINQPTLGRTRVGNVSQTVKT
jgi:hypothetical protein